MSKFKDGFIRILLTMLLTFLIGAVLIVAIGESPITAYTALLKGAFVGKLNLGTTLASFTPLLLTSCAFVVAAQVGAFNVGVEGEVFLGGIVAAYIGYKWTFLPKPVLLLACFAGALIVAAGLCMKQGNRAMIREVSLGFGQLSGIFWYLFSVANYSTPKDWDGTEEAVFRGFLIWMQGRNELCAWALFAVGILAAVLFTYRIRTGGKEGEQERGREAWMHK